MWDFLVKFFGKYCMRSVSVKITEHCEVFYSDLVDVSLEFDDDLDEFVIAIRMVINENGGTIERWFIHNTDVALFNISLEDRTIELVLKNGLRLEFEISCKKEDDEHGED